MLPLRLTGILAAVLLLAYGCTDGSGPLEVPGDHAVVEFVAPYGDLAETAGIQEIDSVRVTVLGAATGDVLGSATEAVPATGDSIRMRLDVTIDGGSLPSVIVTAELLGAGGVVEWSSRSEPVALESETTVALPSPGRGPLDNLSVQELAIVTPSGQVVVTGGSLELSTDVTTDDADATPTIFWSSLDEQVATVNDVGLVSALVRGRAPVVALAGRAADTVEITVLSEGGVPVDPPPLWIDDVGEALGQGDDNCDFIEFGFTFTFYGQDYTGVWVNSNGNVTFENCNTAYSPADVPDDSKILVAPLYGDFDPGDGGDVHWNVVGSAPSRTFVATWLAVPEFSNEVGPGTSTFQVQLREGSNDIVFGYNTLTTDGINWTTGPNGDADMEVGISSGTGAFIRSAVGTEIPPLQATNVCYTPSGSEHVEVDCGQLGSPSLTGRPSGAPAPRVTVTPGPGATEDGGARLEHRQRKLRGSGGASSGR